MKIISGGQKGADLGALLAAKGKNIETGGFIPKGFLTEDGPMPQLKSLGLVEMPTTAYPPRTKKNIEESDITIIFSFVKSAGSDLTIKTCKSLNRPYLVITSPDQHNSIELIMDFIYKNDANIINIAGNRESKSNGIQLFVFNVMSEVIEIFNLTYKDIK
jgi:hypothetical protein